MDEKGLFRLKKSIDEAKQKSSELSGEIKAVQRQLKTDFDCDTLEEAEALLEEFESQELELNKKLSKALEEIEENYSDHE